MWNLILLILFIGAIGVITFYLFHKKDEPNLLFFPCVVMLILLGALISLMVHIRKNQIKELFNELYDVHESLENLNSESEYVDKIKMPVYYINLEKSTSRNDFIQTQLQKYGIQGNRVGAIYGKDLVFERDTIQLSDDKNIEFINTFTATPGELGCTLSHIKAIYTAFKNNDKYALIVEDDTSFVLYPHWPIDLHKIMEEAPKDWNTINLFSGKQGKDDYIVCSDISCNGTVAYIINRKGMENVISDILKHNIINLQVKSFSDNLGGWERPYLASDFLIYYKSGKTYFYNGYSTIVPFNGDVLLDSTIHPSHTDSHVKLSLKAIKKYLIETKNGTFIRKKTWSSDREIPKIIHLITESPENVRKKLQHIGNINPDFEYVFWNESSGKQLIQEKFPEVLDTYNSYDTMEKKINALRYFILLEHGGVFLDHISTPINFLLTNGFAIFNEDDGVICNDFMASCPKHPIFENIIILLPANASEDVAKANGSEFLSQCVKNYKNQDVVILNKKMDHETNSELKEKYKELLPGIHRIMYINLDKRKDRRDEIIDEFQKLGIDPCDLIRIKAEYTPENGAIGCFLSHVKALQKSIYEFPGQNILICEDDLHFPLSKEETLEKMRNFVKDPLFDRRDVWMISNNPQKMEDTHNSNVKRLLEAQMSSGYVANTKYLEKILHIYLQKLKKFQESGKWTRGYCNDQCWKPLQKVDKWYSIKPNIGIQRESFSDIENKKVNYKG